MYAKREEIVEPGRRRRRYSDEFKAEVVAKCRQAGVSVASVALAHGLNANLLRRWVVERVQSAAASGEVDTRFAPQFVALPMPESAPNPSPDQPMIVVELVRDGTRVVINWPVSASKDCAVWLRSWLG